MKRNNICDSLCGSKTPGEPQKLVYISFFFIFLGKKKIIPPCAGNFVRVKQNELPVSAQGLLTKACHTALTEQMRVEEHM